MDTLTVNLMNFHHADQEALQCQRDSGRAGMATSPDFQSLSQAIAIPTLPCLGSRSYDESSSAIPHWPRPFLCTRQDDL